MQQTENYIRERVRHDMPEIVDDLKTQVAERLCSTVLSKLVNVEEGVTFNFYLDHFLVRDIKVIIDQEVAHYLKNPPVKSSSVKVKGAL